MARSEEWPDESRYQVPRPAPPARESPRVGSELPDLTMQLETLQHTAMDLVSSTDLSALLPLIIERAQTALPASRYLLAVQLPDEDGPRIHATGVEQEQASRLGRLMLRKQSVKELCGGESGTVLVADVSSHRVRYGRLAAFVPGDDRPPESYRRSLDAYASLAAAAIDTVNFLDAARLRRTTAEALLGLSRSLAGVDDATAVAQAVAKAVPSVTGADRSSVMLWDETERRLWVAATHGFDEELERAAAELTIRPTDTPELARILIDPAPRFFARPCEDPFLAAVMDRFRSDLLAVCPMVRSHRMLGIVVANFSQGVQHRRPDRELFRRMAGIADQAATAVANADLVEQMQYRATHDQLTGLPNRTLLEDRVSQALKGITRDGGSAAVAFVDLDRFKKVNDTLGHLAGDELLRETARRLVSRLREADSVSRVGGDEFTILAPGVASATDVEAFAGRLMDAFAMPFLLEGHEVYVTPSVGVALGPVHGSTAGELLRHADEALYEVKGSGRNGWRLYEPGRTPSSRDVLTLETELRRALAEGQIVPYYQPQLELTTGRPVGAEVLVRWAHPQRGLLSPDKFLPVAEETGLIVDLDLEVLRQACVQGARWREDGSGPTNLAVNLSGRTLVNSRFLPRLTSILDETGFPADALELELTETHLVSDLALAVDITAILNDIGCTIAIDDVGTGYSTLMNLFRLPARRLKIDRAFVAGLPDDPRMVRAIVAMGRELGREVVGEGVETAAQLDSLVSAGCPVAQGYLLARPLPADAAGEWWRAQSAALSGLHH